MRNLTILQVSPYTAICLAVLLLNAKLSAQTLPDAGSLRQQIEQQRSVPLPQAAPTTQLAAPPPIKPLQGAVVKVNTWRFAGNTLLSSEQLSQALAPFAGRDLDFAGLQSAADAVTAAYHQEGLIVKPTCPNKT